MLKEALVNFTPAYACPAHQRQKSRAYGKAKLRAQSRTAKKLWQIKEAKRVLRAQEAASYPKASDPPATPTRFEEDVDPAEDPRFGRRKKPT